MYSGRKGSMASFSFRLLLSELPNFFGSSTVSINRLTDLAERCAEVRFSITNNYINYSLRV